MALLFRLAVAFAVACSLQGCGCGGGSKEEDNKTSEKSSSTADPSSKTKAGHGNGNKHADVDPLWTKKFQELEAKVKTTETALEKAQSMVKASKLLLDHATPGMVQVCQQGLVEATSEMLSRQAEHDEAKRALAQHKKNLGTAGEALTSITDAGEVVATPAEGASPLAKPMHLLLVLLLASLAAVAAVAALASSRARASKARESQVNHAQTELGLHSSVALP